MSKKQRSAKNTEQTTINTSEQHKNSAKHSERTTIKTRQNNNNNNNNINTNSSSIINNTKKKNNNNNNNDNNDNIITTATPTTTQCNTYLLLHCHCLSWQHNTDITSNHLVRTVCSASIAMNTMTITFTMTVT